MLDNPFEVSYLIYSISGHKLSFAAASLWDSVSAEKVAYGIKGQNIYFGLVNTVTNELSYTHCSAYGD